MEPLELYFWDVQHGNAAYIKTPAGKHIALDLGVGSYVDGESFSPLAHLKENCGVARLDEVIITHPHTDHIADIEKFDLLKPRVLWRPKHLSDEEIRNSNKYKDKAVIDSYLEINNRYCNPVEKGSAPTDPQNNGGVRFAAFSDTTSSRDNINNHGLVVLVEYSGVKILFPGDIEGPAWRALLNKPQFVSAIKGVDVLVASHHGRESGFCGEIFDHFSPKLTIISDGRAVETSVTDKYCNQTEGWDVYSRGDKKCENRKCVSTREDGVICIMVDKFSESEAGIFVTSQ